MTTSTTPTPTPDLSPWLARHKAAARTRPRQSQRQAQADSTPQPADDDDSPLISFRAGGDWFGQRPPGINRIQWRIMSPEEMLRAIQQAEQEEIERQQTPPIPAIADDPPAASAGSPGPGTPAPGDDPERLGGSSRHAGAASGDLSDH